MLVGDALHSAHYSIGSGTRLALEDVLALVKALESRPGDLGRAFLDYEGSRKPIVKKIVGAATASATWYAAFEQHMKLRSGRVSNERLRQSAPKFMARYEEYRSSESLGT